MNLNEREKLKEKENEKERKYERANEKNPFKCYNNLIIKFFVNLIAGNHNFFQCPRLNGCVAFATSF